MEPDRTTPRLVDDRELGLRSTHAEALELEIRMLGCVNWSVSWNPPDLGDADQLLALTLCPVHHLVDPGEAVVTAGGAWGCDATAVAG